MKIYNLKNKSVAKLTEFVLKRGEGSLSDKGSIVINTGKYTGRSANDRFIVKDDITADTVNWGGANLPGYVFKPGVHKAER